MKGGHRTLQGIWPCPGGGTTLCSAYRAAFAHTWKSPPGQVCLLPGAGPPSRVGGASAGGRVLCLARRTLYSFRQQPAFFYLLWCCSHHPVLIGPRGTSGRRVRGEKICTFSSFLRGPWLFKVLRESALIPGLENRSDLFIFRAAWEEAWWPARMRGRRRVARGCGPGPSAELGDFSLGNCVFLKGGCTEIQPPASLALFS